MSRRGTDGRPGPAGAVLNPDEPDPLARYEYDRGSNYEVDTRLTEALRALVPESELHNVDQRFFQIVHLVTEYAWAAMHYEIRRAARALALGDRVFAARMLERVVGLADLPVAGARLLLTFLPQYNLLAMRAVFPPNTTGLDSPGARNLRRVCRALWQAYETALDRAGVELPALLAHAGREPAAGAVADRDTAELDLLREQLHRLDSKVVEWKQTHLRMVWTQLGGQPDVVARGTDGLPHSLRGSSTADLERMAGRVLFPRLWAEADNTFRLMVGTDGEEAT